LANDKLSFCAPNILGWQVEEGWFLHLV